MTLASTDAGEDLLNLDEVCAMLRITKKTAYTQRHNGTGPPGYKVGKRLLYKRRDVLEWLESRKDATS